MNISVFALLIMNHISTFMLGAYFVLNRGLNPYIPEDEEKRTKVTTLTKIYLCMYTLFTIGFTIAIFNKI